MSSKEMDTFRAEIAIIGVNPFVFVPDAVLFDVFEKAGTCKGPIVISDLKTQPVLNNNIKRAINFLLGNGRFIGRDKP